jgi:hypothetical protein
MFRKRRYPWVCVVLCCIVLCCAVLCCVVSTPVLASPIMNTGPACRAQGWLQGVTHTSLDLQERKQDRGGAWPYIYLAVFVLTHAHARTRTQKAFARLVKDQVMAPFVPEFGGVTVEDGVSYMQLSNLLHGFTSPHVMDCKLGSRCDTCLPE